MKKILFFIIPIFIISCQNKNDVNQQSVTENIQVFTDSLNTISFKAPKDSFVQDGFYSFSSKEMKTKVFLEKLVNEDLGSVFSKEELIDKYKKGLSNVVVESNDDWFIVKGINSNKNIVIVKGMYSYSDRLLSKEENPDEESKYVLLSSRAGILNIQYPENSSEKMNLFSKQMLDSFKVDFDEY